MASSIHTTPTPAATDARSAGNTVRVADLRARLGISRERLGGVLDVSARTIQRWEENDQLPANRWVRNVLLQIDEIVTLGLDVFTPEGLRVVMTTPQPGFGNRSGLEMIEAGKGEEIYGMFAWTYENGLGASGASSLSPGRHRAQARECPARWERAGFLFRRPSGW